MHGVGAEGQHELTKEYEGAMSTADSGSGAYDTPASSQQDNVIATNSNTVDQVHHTIEHTEASSRVASNNTLLGSGQWVTQGDIERVQNLPLQLQLSQNQEFTNPNVDAASAECVTASDLLGATEMLNLGLDQGQGIMSWSGAAGLLDYGWENTTWNHNFGSR